MGEPVTDLAAQVQTPWGFLAVLVLTLGGALPFILKSFRTRAPEQVAAPAAREALDAGLEEFWDMVRDGWAQQETEIGRLSEEAAEARRGLRDAEKAQAEAERKVADLMAQLARSNGMLGDCHGRLQEALDRLRKERPDE